MPVEQSKKLEKKRKIIESAYNLFKAKNMYNTAVDDIVKSAGIARGTFYLYFKDKSDLIEQLVFYKSAESMKEMLKKASFKAGETGSIDEYARVFIDMLIDSLIEHREILTVVNKNLSSCLRLFPDFYDEEAALLYKGISEKFLAYGYSQDKIDRIVYIIIDMISSVCYDAIAFGKPFGIEEMRPVLTGAALSILRDGVNSFGGETHA